MTAPLAELEARIETLGAMADASAADGLLGLGEAVLEHWIGAHGGAPTRETWEGFRLLALQRQGARGQPSFNACRETCRELVYHRNLILADPAHPDTATRVRLASMIALHLYWFVAGKLAEARLGEFCCSSRPIRNAG